ncbi:hypothetical protein V8E36_000267 [Tilletia maclaganii]
MNDERYISDHLDEISILMKAPQITLSIIAAEGVASLFKGAGANILRGIAGAGVLSGYDKLQELMFGKVYSGGSG